MPSLQDTPLTIAGRTFRSRLFVGTGKYASVEQTRDALLASGAEVVTVAVRRVTLAASDAAVAMEMGCDGVLMNTAIAAAKDPVRMASAMRLGVDAGRLAFLAGRMEKRLYANASSPLEGTIAPGTRGHDKLGLE